MGDSVHHDWFRVAPEARQAWPAWEAFLHSGADPARAGGWAPSARCLPVRARPETAWLCRSARFEEVHHDASYVEQFRLEDLVFLEVGGKLSAIPSMVAQTLQTLGRLERLTLNGARWSRSDADLVAAAAPPTVVLRDAAADVIAAFCQSPRVRRVGISGGEVSERWRASEAELEVLRIERNPFSPSALRGLLETVAPSLRGFGLINEKDPAAVAAVAKAGLRLSGLELPASNAAATKGLEWGAVVRLDLSYTDPAAARWCLRQCRLPLEELSVRGVVGAGRLLEPLDGARLRTLDCGQTDATDAQLSGLLRGGLLEELRVDGTRVSDATGADLGAHAHLRLLDLSSTGVTQRTLGQLAKLPRLEFLDLADCPLGVLSDDDSARFESLRHLNLESTYASTSGAVWSSHRFPSLRRLVLYRTTVSNEDLDGVRDMCASGVLTGVDLRRSAVNPDKLLAILTAGVLEHWGASRWVRCSASGVHRPMPSSNGFDSRLWSSSTSEGSNSTSVTSADCWTICPRACAVSISPYHPRTPPWRCLSTPGVET